jgi:hypothetical protein
MHVSDLILALKWIFLHAATLAQFKVILYQLEVVVVCSFCIVFNCCSCFVK